MIVLLASFLFNISISISCDFNSEVKSVYSLSGPVTLILKDLGLVNNKKLKGVSVFHPVSKKEFQGNFLPGGVFLSHETIKSLSGSVLFYDESRELSRIFSRYEGIRAVEIKTRSLTPMEVMKVMEKQLTPFLVGCDLKKLTNNLKMRLEELKKLARKDSTFLFFLGLIQNNKYPELVMVQDGIVKWMIQEKLIKTYPSELAYVNWSARILNNLPKETYKVGLRDSGSSMETELKKDNHTINLTYPGALIPGSGQVEAMIYLFKNL
jgi:hypothetical protein